MLRALRDSRNCLFKEQFFQPDQRHGFDGRVRGSGRRLRTVDRAATELGVWASVPEAGCSECSLLLCISRSDSLLYRVASPGSLWEAMASIYGAVFSVGLVQAIGGSRFQCIKVVWGTAVTNQGPHRFC